MMCWIIRLKLSSRLIRAGSIGSRPFSISAVPSAPPGSSRQAVGEQVVVASTGCRTGATQDHLHKRLGKHRADQAFLVLVFQTL